ncbi:MAG TPA: sarcosine oxidase subunit delta [Rhodobacteraceae bacterium]|nr:sarcosine oxidase subunit delta [Paracoccaceae bacterium]
MRINCPHCGARDSREFKYFGDAKTARGDDFASTYLRDNPTGEHTELWQHVSGCRAWLEVVRNVTTHKVISIKEVGQ